MSKPEEFSVEFQREVVRKLGFNPDTFDPNDPAQSDAIAQVGAGAQMQFGKFSLDEITFIARWITGRST